MAPPNHRYMISERQLIELESCLESLEARSVSLWPISLGRRSRSSDHAPLQTIYMFHRANPAPIRIYIGQSFFGRDRIKDQVKNRKWATHVTSLEFNGYLQKETLRILETCVLRRGLKAFPGAAWHNEQGLIVRSPDPLMRMAPCPELDALVSKVLKVFSDALPRSVLEPLKQYPITHTLGGPGEEFYGLLSQRGRRMLLLKGSRISARARNIIELRGFGGAGWLHGNKLHWEGKIERRRATQKRPAGLVITEPVKFDDKREAARFLTLDDARFLDSWHRVGTCRST